jgi:type II secretory pathway component GspD/PulD (secretin)
MKTKILTTLAAICVAGLLVPAIAQTSNDAPESNNPAATPDQPEAAGAANADMAAPEAAPPPTDAGAAAVTPADAAAMLGAMAAAAGETTGAPGEAAAEPAPRPTTPRFAASRGATRGGFNPGGPMRGYSPNAGGLETASSPFTPPAQPVAGATNGVSLHFEGAPLNQVLNYLADAAGFIIVQTVRSIYGTATIHGNNLSRQECADALNAQLNLNDLAAVFDGKRTLTIMSKQDAKTADIPVIIGNDPASIPSDARMVTQIIPIRFVDAGQLVSDLSLFVSPQASIEANTAGNSILITDTQSNIHHLMEIIKAVDESAQMQTVVHTFYLHYASPVDVASELTAAFPSSSGASAPISVFGGRGGRGGGGNPFANIFGGGGGGGESTADRIQRAQQINVVPDSRVQAVIVTAPKDMMDQIEVLVAQLDMPSDRDQKTYVFSVTNADPYQVATELQSMFNSTARSSGQQTSPLYQRTQSTIQNSQVSQNTGLSTTGTTAGGR